MRGLKQFYGFASENLFFVSSKDKEFKFFIQAPINREEIFAQVFTFYFINVEGFENITVCTTLWYILQHFSSKQQNNECHLKRVKLTLWLNWMLSQGNLSVFLKKYAVSTMFTSKELKVLSISVTILRLAVCHRWINKR